MEDGVDISDVSDEPDLTSSKLVVDVLGDTYFVAPPTGNIASFVRGGIANIGINNKIFHRLCVPLLMPNSISAWLSIIFDLHIPNFTINASCASGTIAIGQAFEKIKYQDYDMAITGGVESLKDSSGATMRTFDVLNVLTKSTDGKPRPFSEKRSGFLYNEGAGCILILEELNHAINRGAKIYAEIIDFVSNSDSYNIVQIDKSGKAIKKLFSKINYKNVDYINLHGTGTLLNDQVEKSVIKDLYGKKNNQPICNTTKGIIGHTIGASGAIESAVCALSILTNNTYYCVNIP